MFCCWLQNKFPWQWITKTKGFFFYLILNLMEQLGEKHFSDNFHSFTTLSYIFIQSDYAYKDIAYQYTVYWIYVFSLNEITRHIFNTGFGFQPKVTQKLTHDICCQQWNTTIFNNRAKACVIQLLYPGAKVQQIIIDMEHFLGYSKSICKTNTIN